MAKRALITGFTGMVGSHLADFLIKNTDWEIFGICRWRSNMENIEHLIDKANSNSRINILYGDLNDSASLDKNIKDSLPDYVFHLGAQSYPKTSFDSPADTLTTNIIGTVNLLEAIRAFKDSNLINPVVHVCASSEVFGRVPKDKIPIVEDERFHPASPYAISKVGTDLVGRFYGEAYDMKVMTTRMFTHTGPRRGDVFAESSFAKQIAMIEAGLISPVIKVGNLNSLRTFLDVRDAVRAYFMLVTINPMSGEYYNIGGTHTCEIGDMLNHLIGISTSKDIEVVVDKDRLRPIDADLQVPDTTKFTNHTGWSPEISFDQTMQDLLDFWRDKISSGNYLDR
tara:strand:- start:3467 stop:4486 length:1020 start_codon:yes stop_codon:yes gene_type:complete